MRTLVIDLERAIMAARDLPAEILLANPSPQNPEDERAFADRIDAEIDVLACDTESDVYAAVLALGIKIGANYAANDIVRRLEAANTRKGEAAA